MPTFKVDEVVTELKSGDKLAGMRFVQTIQPIDDFFNDKLDYS